MNKESSLKQDEPEKPSKRRVGSVGKGFNMTPLFFAKTPEDVEKSLRAGIEINHKDCSGGTALDWCIARIIEAKESCEDVVIALIKYGGTYDDHSIEQLEKANPVFAKKVRKERASYLVAQQQQQLRPRRER